MTVTRRDFLKLSSSAGLALAWATALEHESVAAQPAVGQQLGVLIDITRCIGCRTCEAVCAEANTLPPETQARNSRNLSARKFTVVQKETVSIGNRQTLTRFVKRQCMHCLAPACASVCPVGAFTKSDMGAVIYDGSKCIGCRYCMTACPFDVPRYEWESAAPLIRKRQFCLGRLQSGQPTACSQACPAGAIKCGLRSDLLAEAAARIKANPTRYIDYIYGKDEVGGASVLYLSDVPFEDIGFRMDLPKDPLPERTHAVMSKIPPLIVGLAVVLGAGTALAGRTAHSETATVQDSSATPTTPDRSGTEGGPA